MELQEMTEATYKAELKRFTRDAEQSGDLDALYRAHMLNTFDEVLELIGKLCDRVVTLEQTVKVLKRTA